MGSLYFSALLWDRAAEDCAGCHNGCEAHWRIPIIRVRVFTGGPLFDGDSVVSGILPSSGARWLRIHNLVGFVPNKSGSVA